MSGNGRAPKAVLIVEDAETCASTLEIIFSSIHGLKISDGVERGAGLGDAGRPAREHRAIVTDLHMPGMDGFELIDRVRAHQRHNAVPIVVITGSTDPHVPGSLAPVRRRTRSLRNLIHPLWCGRNWSSF